MKAPLIALPKGVQHMLVSTFFFGIMNVCLKFVSHVPPMEIVLFRCTISALLCLPVIYRNKLNWAGSNRLLLILRGVFGTIALYTFFVTLEKMPLGTAVTIQYLSPIFTTIIAIFVLSEEVYPVQWLFFLISFAGVLVIKGFDNRISTGMLLLGIGSAMASGFAYNMVRKLKEKEHYIVIVLHFQLVGIVTGGAFSAFNWQMPAGCDWALLALIGITSQLGQVNLTKALQHERIANATILNYLGVVYALFFGLVFFHEHYGFIAITGIVLVMSGVLMNFFYTKSKKAVIAEQELTTIEE